MSFEERMKDFYERKKHQLGMGGPERLKRLAESGKMNARERIEYFFDPDTFEELGLFTASFHEPDREKTPTDAKIVGTGKVSGRLMAAVANDITIKGASSSYTNAAKIEHMRALSCNRGMPLVFLGESTGARMPDSLGSFNMAMGALNPVQYQRLRQAPWISALMGPCFGSSSLYAAMSDINVMWKKAYMGIVSPKVTEMAMGEKISYDELCGWRINSEVTGMVDAVCETEKECMDLVRQYLSYLPPSQNQPAPLAEVPEGSGRGVDTLLDMVPDKRNRAYDMARVLERLFDQGSVLELKKDFGRPVITSLARIGGYPVGVIANNPMHGAGALDADACEKATNLLVLADSYNLPVINLVDTPGFMIGKRMEQRKIMGKIINWMNALALVTTPKITIIIRKVYGQAYLNMGCGKNADVVVAWPSAEISFMDPATGVNVVHGVSRQTDPERFEELFQEFSRGTEPWGAATHFGLNDVIDPADTRGFLVRQIEARRGSGVGKHMLANWPTNY